MNSCYICNKDEKDLKPFGGPGDPLVGDFTGRKLVKTFRALYEGPNIEKYEHILNELNDDATNIKELEDKFGLEEVEKAFNYDQAKNTVGSSWECRDCIIK